MEPEDKQTTELVERLIALINSKVNIPFLSETMEEELIRFIIGFIYSLIDEFVPEQYKK